MLTPEQKAAIARANGAKSKGPITPEGKERSSRNALKSGEHANKFRYLLPPHPIVLCHEDRAMFYDMFDLLLKTYRPSCEVSTHVVREIAYAQWEIDRNQAQKTAMWNSELVRQAAQHQNVVPELHQLEAMNAATRILYGRGGVIPRLNSEIHRLTRQIVNLEKRLRFLNSNFPAFDPGPQTSEEERAFFIDPEPEPEPETHDEQDQKRTDPDSPQPIENTENGVEENEENKLVAATGNDPEFRGFHDTFFPDGEFHVVQTRKPISNYYPEPIDARL